MFAKIIKIFKTEIFLYILIGGLTTLLNFLLFFILNKCFESNLLIDKRHSWFIAEGIAFLLATMFAFLCDKFFVFKSHNMNINIFFREMIEFFSFRIASEIINVFGMSIYIYIIKLDKNISKLLMSIVVVVLNYLCSKFIIFKKNG